MVARVLEVADEEHFLCGPLIYTRTVPVRDEARLLLGVADDREARELLEDRVRRASSTSARAPVLPEASSPRSSSVSSFREDARSGRKLYRAAGSAHAHELARQVGVIRPPTRARSGE